MTLPLCPQPCVAPSSAYLRHIGQGRVYQEAADRYHAFQKRG